MASSYYYNIISALISCITGVPAPVGPFEVTPIVASNNTVGLKLLWNRVIGQDITYEVQNKTANSNEWSTAVPSNTTGRNQILTGLHPNTRYDVRVRAVSTDGNGEWTQTVQAVRTYQC